VNAVKVGAPKWLLELRGYRYKVIGLKVYRCCTVQLFNTTPSKLGGQKQYDDIASQPRGLGAYSITNSTDLSKVKQLRFSTVFLWNHTFRPTRQLSLFVKS